MFIIIIKKYVNFEVLICKYFAHARKAGQYQHFSANPKRTAFKEFHFFYAIICCFFYHTK